MGGKVRQKEGKGTGERQRGGKVRQEEGKGTSGSQDGEKEGNRRKKKGLWRDVEQKRWRKRKEPERV